MRFQVHLPIYQVNDLPLSLSSVDAFKEETFLYPNPAPENGLLFSKQRHQFKVMDIMGRILFETDYTNQLDISELNAGIYLISNEAGQIQRIKK